MLVTLLEVSLNEKAGETNEPECFHAKHFCETSCLNSFVFFFHVSSVTVPVHCRLWNAKGGGVQSVECEESRGLCGERSVQTVRWGLWSAQLKCKV